LTPVPGQGLFEKIKKAGKGIEAPFPAYN